MNVLFHKEGKILQKKGMLGLIKEKYCSKIAEKILQKKRLKKDFCYYIMKSIIFYFYFFAFAESTAVTVYQPQVAGSFR